MHFAENTSSYSENEKKFRVKLQGKLARESGNCIINKKRRIKSEEFHEKMNKQENAKWTQRTT